MSTPLPSDVVQSESTDLEFESKFLGLESEFKSSTPKFEFESTDFH